MLTQDLPAPSPLGRVWLHQLQALGSVEAQASCSAVGVPIQYSLTFLGCVLNCAWLLRGFRNIVA